MRRSCVSIIGNVGKVAGKVVSVNSYFTRVLLLNFAKKILNTLYKKCLYRNFAQVALETANMEILTRT